VGEERGREDGRDVGSSEGELEEGRRGSMYVGKEL